MKQNTLSEILTVSYFLDYSPVRNEREVTIQPDCPFCAFTWTTHSMHHWSPKGSSQPLRKASCSFGFRGHPACLSRCLGEWTPGEGLGHLVKTLRPERNL